MTQLQTALAALRRILNFLDAENEAPDPAEGPSDEAAEPAPILHTESEERTQ